ncbi:MAG: TlyA family RNA methyltransferase [Nitrospirota bacterium]|nr:TlyA family RNA methyltransferase [Nitrospirota bacterium]
MTDGKETRKPSKVRLDRLLSDRGFVESREKGRALILAGQILVNGQKVDKAGALVPPDADIRILGQRMAFVSRGGLKLDAALREFGIDVSGKTALDVGASTGGFTDCLLQRGSVKVYAVDVGYGQMAWKLQQDPRVALIDRSNIREMDPGRIPELVDIVVIDVSFISLNKVVPAILRFLKKDAELIALVKPQFEVGKELVGKGGIVKDEGLRTGAVENVRAMLRENGFEEKGMMRSPITGQDGNVEFLLYALWRT